MPPRTAAKNPLVPPAVLEYIKEPIFDSVVVPQAWAGEVRFFVASLGEAMQNASAAYNKSGTETNMLSAGKLPLPQVAQVHAYRFRISQLSDVDDALKFTSAVREEGVARNNPVWNDMLRIWYGSYLEFEVSQKPYMQRPTWKVPTAEYLSHAFDLSANDDGAAGGMGYVDAIAPAMDGPLLDLQPHRIYLYPEQQFSARLVPRPGGYTQSVELKVYFVLEASKGRETL